MEVQESRVGIKDERNQGGPRERLTRNVPWRLVPVSLRELQRRLEKSLFSFEKKSSEPPLSRAELLSLLNLLRIVSQIG